MQYFSGIDAVWPLSPQAPARKGGGTFPLLYCEVYHRFNGIRTKQMACHHHADGRFEGVIA